MRPSLPAAYKTLLVTRTDDAPKDTAVGLFHITQFLNPASLDPEIATATPPVRLWLFQKTLFSTSLRLL